MQISKIILQAEKWMWFSRLEEVSNRFQVIQQRSWASKIKKEILWRGEAEVQNIMKEWLLLSLVSSHVHWLLDTWYLWTAGFNFSVTDTVKQSVSHFLYFVLGEETEKLIQKTQLTLVVCLKMRKATMSWTVSGGQRSEMVFYSCVGH